MAFNPKRMNREELLNFLKKNEDKPFKKTQIAEVKTAIRSKRFINM